MSGEWIDMLQSISITGLGLAVIILAVTLIRHGRMHDR